MTDPADVDGRADRVDRRALRVVPARSRQRRLEHVDVTRLAVEVGQLVLGLGLVPDDRHVAGVAGRDPRPQHPDAVRVRHCHRRRPGLAEIGRRDEHDRVGRGRPRAVTAPGRPRLAVVGVPDEVDGTGRVDRDRRPVRVHRRAADGLVRSERRAARRERADPDAEAPVAVLEHRRLDEVAVETVVLQLAEGRPRAAVGQGAGVSDSGRAASQSAVVRDEYLVPQAAGAFEGVRPHEHLVRLAAGEPRPVAVVAVRRAAIPRHPAVNRREERVVREIDARVVDPPARILGQIRIAEAGVGRIRRALRAEVAVSEPVRAAVTRRPDADLVAVVRDEVEVPPGRRDDAVPVEVGRPFVRRVDQGAVEWVGHDRRLAARELLIDIDP